MSPDIVSYLHDEFVGKGQKPTTDVLNKLLPSLLLLIPDIQIIIDGIDEVSPSEHRKLISDLMRLAKTTSECKLLLISQEIPSISRQLSKQIKLRMADEQANIQKDLSAIIYGSLRDIDSQHDGALGEDIIKTLQDEILLKAEGNI